jgi:hypothetical protein
MKQQRRLKGPTTTCRGYLSQVNIHHLVKHHPASVNSLAPLDSSYHIASLQYTLARLQGAAPVLPRYRWLLQRGSAARNSQLRPAAFWMPFWIVSILLPRVLFCAAYTFLVTPSRVKQALARLWFHKLPGAGGGIRFPGTYVAARNIQITDCTFQNIVNTLPSYDNHVATIFRLQ